MTTKRCKRLLSRLCLIVMLCQLTLPAAAVGTVGFSVHAVIPDNQIDKNQTYFDLLMEPGGKQDLAIRVTNSEAKPITVRISAISASTNANGLIDYKTPDIRDETLKIPFSDIASPLEDEMAIPAGETRTATVRVTMPDAVYDGIILGGIVFEKVEAETAGTGGGTSISNVYNYVVGVQLTETDVEVLPSFELIKTEPGLANYRTAIIHSIRNAEAAIARGIDLQIDIYKKGSNTPFITAEATDLRMAPNSVLPYAVMWDGALKPGDYVSEVRLNQGGKQWIFREDFTIDRGQADDINDEAIDENRFFLPWWAIALFALLALLILLTLFLLFLLFKRRREEDEEAAGNQIKLQDPTDID